MIDAHGKVRLSANRQGRRRRGKATIRRSGARLRLATLSQRQQIARRPSKRAEQVRRNHQTAAILEGRLRNIFGNTKTKRPARCTHAP
jgi:hypothetical protein